MAIHSYSSSSATLRRVLRLLETLGSTSSGSTIYHHIERCFLELESTQLESETQYIELLELLLDALTHSLGQDSPLYTSGHILRTTLVPPLLPHELRRLKTDTKQLIAQLHQQDGFEPSSPNHSVIPRSGQTAATVTSGYDLERQNRNSTTAPGHFDQSLQETRSNLQSIKGKLDRQIEQAVAYNNELAHLIKASMEAIRVVDAKQDVDEMRITHLQHYIKLFKEHQDLTTKFSTIQQQLNAFENESQQLDDELTRVHMLSVTDELTQLPNRRAFIQRLDNEMARVQRYGSPLALAIIDLDEFKPINDTFGHNAGDQVLRYFAETALTVLRHHDTVARYGGEEFAVLMPNTEIEGALCTLKKIQSEVAGSLCRLDDGVEITAPTFSAGVALYNPGESPEELIKRADTAMYRAKHSGRNRIEVHTMGTKQKLQAT
ncbi:MAG: diguanylate cyclase [Pseudomonadota bacterium]|nr:diguanylate cyclase [Pseudomonadota bacterium]